jgi:hypothetical protein
MRGICPEQICDSCHGIYYPKSYDLRFYSMTREMVVSGTLGPSALVCAKKNLCDVAQVFAFLSIVILDPLRDRLLQRRTSMLALQFPKGFLADVSDVNSPHIVRSTPECA